MSADWGGIASNVVELTAPVLASVSFTAAIVYALFRTLQWTISGPDLLIAVSFGLLGGIAGAIAGSSQDSLVGGLISAVLGMATAIMSYGYGKDANPKFSALFPVLTFMLLINVLSGLATGQSWRKKWDAYEIDLAEYRTDYDKIYAPMTLEIRKMVFDLCVKQHQTYDAVTKNCNYSNTLPLD